MGKIRIPLCIGHRGAAAAFPENTLASFRAALAAGADGVELDTHVTRDGVAIVFHDDSLTRLTGARGRIARKTFAELAELRVRGGKIPTLSEVLSFLAPRRAIIQVEIKRGVPVAPVIRVISRCRAGVLHQPLGAAGDGWRKTPALPLRAKSAVILASFSPDAIRAVAELAPRIPRMLIAERPRFRTARASALHLLESMAAVGASGISVDHRAITQREFVETVHAHGVALWCWTVNDAAAMRRLAKWGVDAIISDKPRMLRRILTADAHG